MFGIRNNKQPLKDFSTLSTDLHSHVLPGLDDGSPTLEESLKMLKTWADLGYKKVITTPHVVNAYYPNTKERILGQMYNLQDAIEEHKIPIELEASAEYRLEPEFKKKLESNEIIPFGKENYILVEMPWQRPKYSLEEYLPVIKDMGYKVILAHPERHEYFGVEELKCCRVEGLFMQLNLLSLVGKYGRVAQRVGERLVKEKLIDFVGSDAHCNADLEELRKLWRNKYFIALLESGKLKNIEL